MDDPSLDQPEGSGMDMSLFNGTGKSSMDARRPLRLLMQAPSLSLSLWQRPVTRFQTRDRASGPSSTTSTTPPP